MKLTFLLFIILCCSNIYSQSGYCNGWEVGYKKGYCYNEYGCVAPVAPVCPVANIGEETYIDGYNRGLIQGSQDSKTNNQRINTSISPYESLRPLNGDITDDIKYYGKNYSSSSSYRLKRKKRTKIIPKIKFETIIDFKGMKISFLKEFLSINKWKLESENKEDLEFVYANSKKRKDKSLIKVIYDSEDRAQEISIITHKTSEKAEFLVSIQSKGATLKDWEEKQNIRIERYISNSENYIIKKEYKKANKIIYTFIIK